VKRALESVKGVKSASASFAEKKAVVFLYDPTVGLSLLLDALSRQGFSGNLDLS
jgi:copper chaperone CopZ